jgi:hypothetical protein
MNKEYHMSDNEMMVKCTAAWVLGLAAVLCSLIWSLHLYYINPAVIEVQKLEAENTALHWKAIKAIP